MESTLKNYIQVYRMLEDEESRDIYLRRLNWLISGDKKYIDSIVAAYLPEAPLFKTFAEIRDSIPDNRKVILYGAGELGRKVLLDWQKDERLFGFCDQSKQLQKSGCLGWPVISPEELLSRKDFNVVISTSVKAYEEIHKILEVGGYPQNQVYSLNAALSAYEDPGQYFSPDFMRWEDEEILIDAGCLDLSSSLLFKQYCNHVKKVYAFEPDPKNYQICVARKEENACLEVEILPFGVWSEQSELQFDASNDGSSHVCSDGSIHIPVMPIDKIVDPEDKITLIKMDVEGAELEGLKGAQETIRRNKPKLAICIYHKPQDMVEIPLYIKTLVPEYKLYVRHHSNAASETVLYAVGP